MENLSKIVEKSKIKVKIDSELYYLKKEQYKYKYGVKNDNHKI
jgi:hypothetical protein